MRRHTRKWKEAQLGELKKLIDSHKVVAVAKTENLPANMLQEIKIKLADKAKIKFSKVRIIKKALLESKFGRFDWDKRFSGQVALIASDLDPFELFSLVKKNKVRTYLKVGAIADKDVIVPAGDTKLPPGPDLSLLKAANLPVAMQGSSIKILKDTVVLRKGETVTQEIANALMKLDIKPYEIMLRIAYACDGETLYSSEQLDIDFEKVKSDIQNCYRNAFCLAYNIGYITPQNITLLLQRGYREALEVARRGSIITKETLPELIIKARLCAEKLNSVIKTQTT
ncbi:MAG: 50S ribosomal protein L10 [Candidatus Diapherotrites archaeon]